MICVMRIFFIGTFLIISVVVGFQLYRLYEERAVLVKEVRAVREEALVLEEEQLELGKELEYFADTQNLLKELKSLFNYRKPNEKLIIIVPKE